MTKQGQKKIRTASAKTRKTAGALTRKKAAKANASALDLLREFYEAEKDVTSYENGELLDEVDADAIYRRIEQARKAARTALASKE